jgi:hypothetical protein
MSKIPAKKGWNEIKAYNLHNKAEALTDGVIGYKGCISTYGRTSHSKRVTLVLDLEQNKFVDHVGIWNNTSNQLDFVELSFCTIDADGKEVWSKPEKFEPEYNEKLGKHIQKLPFPVKKEVRKIQVVCQNHKPMSLVIFELKLFDQADPVKK